MMYPMNWVLLVCFLVAAAAVVIGLVLVGLQALRLYRKVQEVQRQVKPQMEALLARQERTMALADMISRRQETLANQLHETAASVGSFAGLLGELREVQEQLTTMAID
jgi:uncharacterized membrane-anchored protein YhcB (DUF1043 family)